jgi:hypothetical protein
MPITADEIATANALARKRREEKELESAKSLVMLIPMMDEMS